MIISQESPARVVFGTGSAGMRRGECGSLQIDLPMPLLGGPGEEALLPADGGSEVTAGTAWDFETLAAGGWLAGSAIVPVAREGMEAAAYRVYRDLLRSFGRDHRFYRIWNYVPHINREIGGLETYRAFNIGRGRAFEEANTLPDAKKLPAASAVGIDDPHLTVVFLAGRWDVGYFENPAQVPAYQYPEAYGPRPPSFCRGATVAGNRGAFLSGTASIRGHQSIAPGDLARQAEVTVDNVELMAETMGAGLPRQFKCYLRRGRRDLEVARRVLEPRLGEGRITYLQADICRSDLLIEVEGVYG